MNFARISLLVVGLLCLGVLAQAAPATLDSLPLPNPFPQTPATATVVLTWIPPTSDANVSPPTGFNVYREQTSGACTATTTGVGPACLKLNSTPLAVTVLTFTDTNVPTSAPLWYTVRSVNAQGESVNSQEANVTFKPPVVVTKPTAPGKANCTATASGGIVPACS